MRRLVALGLVVAGLAYLRWLGLWPVRVEVWTRRGLDVVWMP